MATLSSRDQIVDYAFRRLGDPVIEINVDRQQAEERLDDALQLFTERHFDGVERGLFTYQVTQSDIDNGFVDIDGLGAVNGASGATASTAPTGKDVVSVIKVHRFGDGTTNMFDVRYQMALNDYFGINRNLFMGTGQGLASYSSTKRYISMIQDMFEPEKMVRFNKVTNRLHIDMDWSEDVTVGKFLVIEAYVALNPEIFTEIYNDILLKKYFTALVKRQWGANLSKFDNVALPGGASMRGGEIFREAQEEIDKLEEEVRLTYELPIDFMTG
mgnify:FL=1|jgi:hypothetical protein|tara:strand:+ start:3818 stop:4633 length:816 start_codon:yes stop_codon:yes gene_type:complete